MATWSVRHVRDDIGLLGVAASVLHNVETPPDELAYIVGCTLDELTYIFGCIAVFCPDVLTCISSCKTLSGLHVPACNTAFAHVLSPGFFVSTP